MKNAITDFVSGTLVVAGIFVFVRPRSQGPALVTAVANGFSGVLGAATGGGGFN